MIKPEWVLALAGVALVGCASNPARPSGYPKVAYCAELISHFNVQDCPKGGLIGEEVQRQRVESYRVTRDDVGRVARVDHIDGRGALLDFDNTVSQAYQYVGEADIPSRVTLTNATGDVVEVRRVSDGGATIEHFDAYDRPRPEKNTLITRVRYTFDANGWRTGERHENPHGKPARDTDDAYGYVYTSDDWGLAATWTALDADGKPMAQHRWSTHVELERDDQHRVIRRKPMDGANALVIESNGSAGNASTYDAYGNEIRRTYLGLDGKPAPEIHGTTFADLIADSGRLATVHWLDAAGKPAFEDNGAAGIEFRNDTAGTGSREVVLLGLDGRPINGKQGFASRVEKRDSGGRVIEERYFDAAAQPTNNDEGVAYVTFARDAHGNILEKRYFDVRGALVLNKQGFAIRKCEYDEFDQPTLCETLDTHEHLAAVHDGFYSSVKTTYDANGYVREEAYASPLPDVPPRVHGGSRRALAHDDLGLVTSEGYYDEHGDLTPNGVSGYARAEVEHDEQGATVGLKYFGTDGALLQIYRITRDSRGSMITREVTDGAGKPIGPVYRTRFEYDARGLTIGIHYEDLDGKPVADKSGAANIRRKLDANGRIAEERWFGADGKPLARGPSGYDYRFDGFGRVIEETWVDGAGAPLLTGAGWATKKTIYDRLGFVLRESYFDASGKPTLDGAGVGSRAWERDRYGQQTSYRVFDADDKPMLIPGEKYHGWKLKLDARGNTVEKYFLDENERMMTGYLSISTVYDENDRAVEQRYRNREDSFAANTDGVATTKFQYTPRGLLLDEAYFGLDGKPVALASRGFAERRFVYDDVSQHVTEESLYGLDGKAVDCAEGWSVRKLAWVGDKHEDTYYATTGEKVEPHAPKPSP